MAKFSIPVSCLQSRLGWMCCLRVASANQAEWDISCQNPEGLPEQERHGTVACIAAGAGSWCATKQGKANGKKWFGSSPSPSMGVVNHVQSWTGSEGRRYKRRPVPCETEGEDLADYLWTAQNRGLCFLSWYRHDDTYQCGAGSLKWCFCGGLFRKSS